MRRALLTLAVVGGLLIGALPAKAGTLEWTDKKGDATTFGAAGAAPNEPSLDVLKVTMKSDAKTLTWVAHMDKMKPQPALAGQSIPPIGYFVRFNWTYAGLAWAIRSKNDPIEKTFQFRLANDNVGIDIPCKDCKVDWAISESRVTLTAPIQSLAEGVKWASSFTNCPACRGATMTPIEPPKKGAEFSGLSVGAFRSAVRVFFLADDAPADADAVFTL